MDFPFRPAFPADAEGRVGLALGVEFHPVGDPLPHRVGNAAADHQVRAEAGDLPVQGFGWGLEHLDVGAKVTDRDRKGLPVGGELVGQKYASRTHKEMVTLGEISGITKTGYLFLARLG